MTIEQISEAIGMNMDKNVLVETDGIIVIGELVDWISALDNEPDGESVILRVESCYVEIPVDEINEIIAA